MWLLLLIVVLPAAFMIAAGWYAAQQLTRRRRPDQASSPAAYGLDFEEVTFTTEDGIPLTGWLIPGERKGAAVIFCHGHAGSMDPDLKYAPWFHERGYTVFMFDFRGHGRSGGEYVSMGYFERRDLLAAESFLVGRGYRDLGVMGFSMGGAVAISTAPLSEHIRAVVADGAFAWLSRAVAAGVREQGMPQSLANAVAWLALRFAGWKLHAKLEQSDPALWVSKVSPRALLLIHGEGDRYTSTEEVRAMHAAAGDPKELWVVPGAGHREVDLWEAEEYREKVLAFFDRWLGGEES